MFIEEINKIEVQDVSYASRSVVCLFKTLTNGLSNPGEDGGGKFNQGETEELSGNGGSNSHDGQSSDSHGRSDSHGGQPSHDILFEHFNNEDWSTQTRDFIAHCEAALASYVKYGDLAICATMGEEEAASLKDLSLVRFCFPSKKLLFMFDLDMKKLDQAVVAVCKFCCPICWEFLHVLRKGQKIQDNLWVRGHHCTLFLVELPDWLPADVLQDMVLRYHQHLHDALHHFSQLKSVPRAQSRHRREPSFQSNSGASTSSHDSDKKDLGTASGYIATLMAKKCVEDECRERS
jgi:hypothetical protein